MQSDPSKLLEAVQEMLEEAVDREWPLPYYATVVAANGSMLFSRYDAGEKGLDATSVAKHHPTGAFVVPVNIILTCPNGKAMLLTIGAHGPKWQLH